MSRRELRALFEQGAVRVNGVKVDLDFVLTPEHLHEGKCLISLGKKQRYVLEVR